MNRRDFMGLFGKALAGAAIVPGVAGSVVLPVDIEKGVYPVSLRQANPATMGSRNLPRILRGGGMSGPKEWTPEGWTVVYDFYPADPSCDVEAMQKNHSMVARIDGPDGVGHDRWIVLSADEYAISTEAKEFAGKILRDFVDGFVAGWESRK